MDRFVFDTKEIIRSLIEANYPVSGYSTEWYNCATSNDGKIFNHVGDMIEDAFRHGTIGHTDVESEYFINYLEKYS